MGMKSGWIKFSGGVDKIASGLAYDPLGKVMGGAVIGAILGTFMTLVVGAYKEEGAQDFSDSVDQDMQIFEDGTLMRFPDVCGLDDNYYLISQKPKSGLEISRGNYDYSHVLTAKEQRGVADEISSCMDAMRGWARKGNFEFANEFRHIPNVEYSEAGLVQDHADATIHLHKDISEVSENDRKSMHNIIKAQDDYVEDGDNSGLYHAAFNAASQSWNNYNRHANDAEVYYNGDEIKNADQYEKYEYSSVGYLDWAKTVGGVGLLALFMMAGGDTRRSNAYETRAAKRRERLSAIKSLSGRDTPIL
jgi:hypothetical protein